MVQSTTMQTNLQGNEQFFLEKVAKKTWVVLTTSSIMDWIKFLLFIVVVFIDVLITTFDFAFFRQKAKEILPYKNDVAEWWVAAFVCSILVVLLHLVLSAIMILMIEKANDTQKIKPYTRQFWGLGLLFLGFSSVALYGSNNGYVIIVKENIVFAKLPENTDLQAAKDSLAASQKYYNTMIAKEQKELDRLADVAYDWKNFANNQVRTQAASAQKQVLINAKLEQAKFWQQRINKIEDAYLAEVQQVKAANKLLETETVSNTKAVSMYAYAALFFLSFVSVLIFYKGTPSPTMQQGAADKSYVADNQGVGNFVGIVGNGGSVGNVGDYEMLMTRKVKISHKGSYKNLQPDEYAARYGHLIALLSELKAAGYPENMWNCKLLDSNIINGTETMASHKGKWVKDFWEYYKSQMAIYKGNYEQALHEQGGQGI
jgi:hypothetical protein